MRAPDAPPLRIAEAAETARRFAAAIDASDPHAARDLTTADGWGSGKESLGGLVGQALRKGFGLDLIGSEPVVFGDRGSAWMAVVRPGAELPLGDLYLLLQHTPEGWRAAGVTKLRAQVGLFLRGLLPGFVDLSALPRSARAEDWAAPVLPALRSETDETLPLGWVVEPPPPGAEVTLIGSAALPQANRAAVGFRIVTADRPWGSTSWTILDTTLVPSQVVAARPYLALETLLTDLVVPWPKEDPEEPGVEVHPPTDPAGAAAILSAVVRETLDEAGVDLEANTREARQGRALLRLAGHVRGTPERGAAPVRPPLPDALVAALEEALEQGVSLPHGGPTLDRSALEARAPTLLGGLFGQLMQQGVPQDLAVPVPVEAPEPGGPTEVVLRLDRDWLLDRLARSPNAP